jgi:hypothetical protein
VGAARAPVVVAGAGAEHGRGEAGHGGSRLVVVAGAGGGRARGEAGHGGGGTGR